MNKDRHQTEKKKNQTNSKPLSNRGLQSKNKTSGDSHTTIACYLDMINLHGLQEKGTDTQTPFSKTPEANN
jgi:hypothetical protein